MPVYLAPIDASPERPYLPAALWCLPPAGICRYEAIVCCIRCRGRCCWRHVGGHDCRR